MALISASAAAVDNLTGQGRIVDGDALEIHGTRCAMKLAAKTAAPTHVAARPRAIASAIRSSRLDDDCRIVCPRFAALAQESQVDDGTAKREGDGPNGWIESGALTIHRRH
ncbi:MAG: hypothetical protein WCA28_03110 [Bradyrhizobium sp.]